jgi:hypothetical protein
MKDKDRMNNLLEEESVKTVIADSSSNRFYKTKQNIAKNTKRPVVNDSIVYQQTNESSVSCSKQQMNRKTNKTKQRDKINYSKKLTFPVLKGKESDPKKNIRNDGDTCTKNIETHFRSVIGYDYSQTPNT